MIKMILVFILFVSTGTSLYAQEKKSLHRYRDTAYSGQNDERDYRYEDRDRDDWNYKRRYDRSSDEPERDYYNKRREQRGNNGFISGKLVVSDTTEVSYATVTVKNTSYKTFTNIWGEFYLELPFNKYTLVVDALGYEKKEITVQLKKGLEWVEEEIELSVIKPKELNPVTVFALKKDQHNPFNISVINTVPMQKLNVDVTSILNRVSGIKIKTEAGIGSRKTFMLNGFSGNHVKIFVDGISNEDQGFDFNISNLPINLIDKVEVYKGVVPVKYGTDAIGGVINIVTKRQLNNQLDLSYATGSYGMQRANIFFSRSFKNGFYIKSDASYTYSKNNYPVYVHVNPVLTEDQINQMTPEEKIALEKEYEAKRWEKRFNDKYQSATLITKFGIINKSFADKFLIGFDLGKSEMGLQTGSTMDYVFGKRKRRSLTLVPSMEYVKKNLFTEKLDMSIYANKNFGYLQYIDTAAADYNWEGKYITTHKQGEGNATLMKLRDNNARVIFNIDYAISDRHRLELNNSLFTVDRKSADPLIKDQNQLQSLARNKSLKNITGISYRYFSENKNWNTIVFGKNYEMKNQQNKKKKSGNYDGYGAATTYIFGNMQAKLSYEKTFRLPDTDELFGDGGGLQQANFYIRPEKSNNVNAGIGYSNTINRHHSIQLDAGLIYRQLYDYIIRQVVGGYSSWKNYGKVRNYGIALDGTYAYKRWLTIGGNFTYQDLRDNSRYKSGGYGVESETYKERVPNVPYLFGNANIGFSKNNLLNKGDNLQISYMLQATHRYFFTWEAYGQKDSKAAIPSQFSHDAYATYSFKDNKMYLSFECNNITNRLLYDDYSFQKPGRNFSFKIGYKL